MSHPFGRNGFVFAACERLLSCLRTNRPERSIYLSSQDTPTRARWPKAVNERLTLQVSGEIKSPISL